MNNSMADIGKVNSDSPLSLVKTETVKKMPVPGSFSLPRDVEENVIFYLEHGGAEKNEFDKALDFFLDLSSDFGIESDRK